MTTIEKTREEAFIERIERLDTGELARLRRACGARDPVEGRCPWLVGLIHGAAGESVAFLTASLLAQYKTAVIRTGRHRIEGNFGITWKRAIARTASDSIKRRFHILLESEYDPRTGEGDLPYRLRQMVRYAAAKGVGVNWPALLTDLKFWNQPEKRVQKRWARSFFSIERPDDAQPSQEEKEK
jgi:CRISPR system Cascade subunit CasB